MNGRQFTRRSSIIKCQCYAHAAGISRTQLKDCYLFIYFSYSLFELYPIITPVTPTPVTQLTYKLRMRRCCKCELGKALCL